MGHDEQGKQPARNQLKKKQQLPDNETSNSSRLRQRLERAAERRFLTLKFAGKKDDQLAVEINFEQKSFR